MIASIFSLAISCCARVMRARRSSLVIGVAWLFIDVSAAMLGGRTPASPPAPRPRCAESLVTDKPAAALVSHRKLRRFNMHGSY